MSDRRTQEACLAQRHDMPRICSKTRDHVGPHSWEDDLEQSLLRDQLAESYDDRTRLAGEAEQLRKENADLRKQLEEATGELSDLELLVVSELAYSDSNDERGEVLSASECVQCAATDISDMRKWQQSLEDRDATEQLRKENAELCRRELARGGE